MTVTKNYYTSSNYETIKPMPTREELHRYASNLISIGDFDTDHSNGIQVQKAGDAIDWTIKKTKSKNKNKAVQRK